MCLVYDQYMFSPTSQHTEMWISNIKDRLDGVTIWTSHYPETLKIDVIMPYIIPV